MELGPNSTENLSLVEQIVEKILMKEMVIFKLPKLIEIMMLHIYLFPWNYTHDFT